MYCSLQYVTAYHDRCHAERLLARATLDRMSMDKTAAAAVGVATEARDTVQGLVDELKAQLGEAGVRLAGLRRDREGVEAQLVQEEGLTQT